MPRILSQEWHPDTCGCVVVLEYTEGMNDFKSVQTKPCPAHKDIAIADMVTVLFEESRRRTSTWAELQKLRADFPFDAFKTAYDDKRLLTIDLGTRLTANQKNTLQARIDSLVGAGKVVIT